MFRFKQRATNYLNKIRENYDTIIGCHLRKGDYESWFERMTQGGKAFSDRQIGRMIDLVQDNIRNSDKIAFVVASDSPNWARNTFRPNNKYTTAKIFFTPEDSSVELDFTILSQCDHNFFLYGTFGFWSAFLNTKKDAKVFVAKIRSGRKSLDQIEQLKRIDSQRFYFVDGKNRLIGKI